MRLSDFVEKNMPRGYQRPLPWHVRQICDVLERGHRERKNVILEVHPRSWKSEIVNVYRPAWWIAEGHVLNHSGVICNSADLAEKFCQACSRLVPLPKDPDRKAEWRLTVDKSLDFTYKAAGIGGQITGWGFDDVVFDDLFKNGQEAKSETKRSSIIDGVVSAAMSRLTPTGIVIAMQARLHPGDTIGWLLNTDMKFLRLHLPATNDDGQSAWFEDGYSGDRSALPAYDAMWPERFPRPVLEQIFDRITSYYRMAQYQQVPSLGDLSYFDVSAMPTYKMIGNLSKMWIGVDAASTETSHGAYTAFICLGLSPDHGDHIKVLGVRRGRWRPDVMNQQLIDFYQAMTRRYGVYPEAVCVEKAAGGYGMLNLPMPVVPMTPKGSKEERAGAVCWLVNKGLVQLPEEAPWLADFKNELENFPLTNFKDQTDAFVHGLAWELRKRVDFEPQMMERYALQSQNQQPTIGGVSRQEIADALEQQEYQEYMSQWDDVTF